MDWIKCSSVQCRRCCYLVLYFVISLVLCQEELNIEDIKRGDLVGDGKHVSEHLEHTKWGTEPQTEDEVEFLFFVTHDNNGDSLLDGLELLAALGHKLDERQAALQKAEVSPEVLARSMQGAMQGQIRYVDSMLQKEDTNNDGYLSYTEFRGSSMARQAAREESRNE